MATRPIIRITWHNFGIRGRQRGCYLQGRNKAGDKLLQTSDFRAVEKCHGYYTSDAPLQRSTYRPTKIKSASNENR